MTIQVTRLRNGYTFKCTISKIVDSFFLSLSLFTANFRRLNLLLILNLIIIKEELIIFKEFQVFVMKCFDEVCVKLTLIVVVYLYTPLNMDKFFLQ